MDREHTRGRRAAQSVPRVCSRLHSSACDLVRHDCRRHGCNATRSDVHSLVLWAPYASGKQFMRESRAFSALRERAS